MQIVLKDKRILGYEIYGDANADKTIFYFHGWPSSRLSGTKYDIPAKELNIKIISVDRPGYGLSDYKPNREILDFPSDIIQLADSLGINKFSIMGISGGGPYSAVCAYKIPERINKAGIIVGLAPIYIDGICEGMPLAYKLCWINYHRAKLLRKLASDSFILRSKLGEWGNYYPLQSKSDKKISRSSFKKAMKLDLDEAMIQGNAGPSQDLDIYTRDWGFNISAIKVKTHLWYGDDDKNVPLAMGKYYESQIDNSVLNIYSGGHFGWFKNIEKILKILTN